VIAQWETSPGKKIDLRDAIAPAFRKLYRLRLERDLAAAAAGHRSPADRQMAQEASR
jgi:hypothetical protein